jgi:DNA-directed RNA polymerase specialized sigma subunit
MANHMVDDSTIHPRTIPIVGIQSGVTDGRVDNQLFMFIIIIYQVILMLKDREQFILKIYLTYIKHKNIKNIRSLNK